MKIFAFLLISSTSSYQDPSMFHSALKSAAPLVTTNPTKRTSTSQDHRIPKFSQHSQLEIITFHTNHVSRIIHNLFLAALTTIKS